MNIELNSHIEGFMQEYHGMLPMPNAPLLSGYPVKLAMTKVRTKNVWGSSQSNTGGLSTIFRQFQANICQNSELEEDFG